MAEELIIDVDEDGEVKITVRGVAGKKCLAATKDIEEALGKVTTRRPTSEMSLPETSTNKRKISA